MERLAILTSEVSRLLRREFDARAKSAGITRPQWRLLTTLRDREGINQGELAQLLLVEPISVCRMIDRLQEIELIERRPDPDDRRSWQLHLLPRARELLVKLRPLAFDLLEDAFAHVSEEEKRATIATLEKVRDNLDCATREDAAHG